MTIQRRFASVVATACILVLAACGGGEPGSQPGVPVTPASHGGTRLTPASRTAGRGAAAAAGRATSLARVYIANDAKNSITAYRPNHTKLLTKITSGVDVPLSVVLDAAGNVYVANENAATVTVYAPGSNAVLRTIATGPHTYRRALAFDAAGDL
jgi:DNA-binding beta-propeller fold protein YncE